MSNENLIPMNKRSKDEAREIGKRGGIKSGIARREKRKLSDILKTMLEMKTTDGDKTNAEAVVAALITSAQEGDIAAIKEVLERTEGKVPTLQNATVEGAIEIGWKSEGND